MNYDQNKLEELENEYAEKLALIDGLPKWAEGQAALTDKDLSNIRESINRELVCLQDDISKAKQALGLADDFADLNEQARQNKLVTEGQCFDEIIQRFTWLLDMAAGGKGYTDYIPADHNPGTRAYIADLEQALKIIMKYAGIAGKVSGAPDDVMNDYFPF